MVKTVLKIDGMMCGMCESHINDCIRKNFDAKKVSSSHAKGRTVILSEAELSSEKLKSVIAETGYTLTDIECGEKESRGGLFSVFRR